MAGESLDRPVSSKRSALRSWVLLGLLSATLTFLLAPASATQTEASPRWEVAREASTNYDDIIAREIAENPALVVQASDGTFLNNNRTDVVQWDKYSLVVQGQRIFLHSGEFHTFRLPVPDLWPDILQKVKAAGLNGVSVYTHWGLINPAPGFVDFNDWRALQPLFDAATAAGIWIVLRPGPYINAESTAGGLAHWATSQVVGTLRSPNVNYTNAWLGYIKGIINQTEPNQITSGGPVLAVQVDNEYQQNADGAGYFQQLEDVYNNSTIIVPLTYNDPGEGKNFVNGTGAVNIYGLDSYPQGFDCSNPATWSPVPSNWQDYHANTDPYEPFYFPEFQGGSFDAWGPTAPGYAQCRVLTGADFQNVFYHALWAANAKLLSFYMIYGGTSWGGIAFPGVYTSYDYGASIAENRVLTSKFDELKRQGIFLRSSPEFYKTDWVGNSSTSAVSISNPAAFAVLLRNPDTNASFYIVRQDDSTSTALTTFNLSVTTSQGSFDIPQTISGITLNGRQSKVIVTDYSFGSSSVLYSTAPVFYAGTVGSRDILFVYGDSDQEHELTLALTGNSSASNSSDITFSTGAGNLTTVTFSSGINGTVTVWDSEEQLILFADSVSVATWWSPVLPGSGNFSSYWQIGSNDSVLVGGPYLVRNASIDGSTLNLIGDLNATVTLSVIASANVTSVTWNGQNVSADASAAGLTSFGGFVGQLSLEDTTNITVPALTGWKYADSLPEIQSHFSDADWTLANHTTTNIPYAPYFTDGLILYGCDYGFCEGHVLYRGHFHATGSEASVKLSTNGGEAYASSVWLNDVFLGTSFGNSTNDANSIAEVNQTFILPHGSVIAGRDNVLTVLVANMGHNEGSEIEQKSPLGIRGFALDSGTKFSEWRLQGKIGGYEGFPDKTRGVLNEGGLFGERSGWHLPGFDTSHWEARDLSDGLPGNVPGVGFFVTTFNLSIPAGYDVPISFNFDDVFAPYRIELFVNGWNMGRRVANLGPQLKFPVHEGILDYQGENTVAVALWTLEADAVSPQLNLTIDGIIAGGVGSIATNNPPFSSEGRS